MKLASHAAAAVLFAAGLAVGAVGLGAFHTPALAQDTAQPAAPTRIATLDVFGIIEKLVQSDRYLPAREANNKEKRDMLDKMVAELEALQQELQTADQTAPDFQPKLQVFEQKRQEFSQAQQTAQADVEKFNTAQLIEAYGLIVDAADKIALERGYSHVVSSRPPRAENKADNLGAGLQEILARGVIRSPLSDDITAAVSAELKLP